MINRHNYEEYFLLYVDNELDEAQRAAVENFIQQNPDVAGEMGMLKHATLLAEDTTQFEPKHLLYKTETGISLANYEEYFLLAVDNELNEHETAELEKFILQHPQLQEEYTLLQQATLPAEPVEFKNKSVLYHTELKKRRIPVLFMRLAVAACMIGFVATLWMVSENSEVSQPGNTHPVVQQKPNASAKNNNEIKIPDAVTPQHLTPLHKINTPGENVAKTNSSHRRTTRSNVDHIKTVKVILQNEAKVEREDEIAIAEPVKPSPKNTIAENTFGQEVNIDSHVNPADKSIARLTYSDHQSTNDKNVLKPAVYQEIENEEEEDNSIYIGAAEFNKTKLKGFLRKAVNFFDKKTSKNDSERTVQIASFQIKSR